MNVLKRKGLIEGEQWYALQFTGDESVGGNLKQVENFFQKIFVSFKIKVSIGYKSRERVYNIEAEVKKHPVSPCSFTLKFKCFILLLLFYRIY
jgi:hypothetical protein